MQAIQVSCITRFATAIGGLMLMMASLGASADTLGISLWGAPKETVTPEMAAMEQRIMALEAALAETQKKIEDATQRISEAGDDKDDKNKDEGESKESGLPQIVLLGEVNGQYYIGLSGQPLVAIPVAPETYRKLEVAMQDFRVNQAIARTLSSQQSTSTEIQVVQRSQGKK